MPSRPPTRQELQQEIEKQKDKLRDIHDGNIRASSNARRVLRNRIRRLQNQLDDAKFILREEKEVAASQEEAKVMSAEEQEAAVRAIAGDGKPLPKGVPVQEVVTPHPPTSATPDVQEALSRIVVRSSQETSTSAGPPQELLYSSPAQEEFTVGDPSNRPAPFPIKLLFTESFDDKNQRLRETSRRLRGEASRLDRSPKIEDVSVRAAKNLGASLSLASANLRDFGKSVVTLKILDDTAMTLKSLQEGRDIGAGVRQDPLAFLLEQAVFAKGATIAGTAIKSSKVAGATAKIPRGTIITKATAGDINKVIKDVSVEVVGRSVVRVEGVSKGLSSPIGSTRQSSLNFKLGPEKVVDVANAPDALGVIGRRDAAVFTGDRAAIKGTSRLPSKPGEVTRPSGTYVRTSEPINLAMRTDRFNEIFSVDRAKLKVSPDNIISEVFTRSDDALLAGQVEISTVPSPSTIRQIQRFKGDVVGLKYDTPPPTSKDLVPKSGPSKTTKTGAFAEEQVIVGGSAQPALSAKIITRYRGRVIDNPKLDFVAGEVSVFDRFDIVKSSFGTTKNPVASYFGFVPAAFRDVDIKPSSKRTPWSTPDTPVRTVDPVREEGDIDTRGGDGTVQVLKTEKVQETQQSPLSARQESQAQQSPLSARQESQAQQSPLSARQESQAQQSSSPETQRASQPSVLSEYRISKPRYESSLGRSTPNKKTQGTLLKPITAQGLGRELSSSRAQQSSSQPLQEQLPVQEVSTGQSQPQDTTPQLDITQSQRSAQQTIAETLTEPTPRSETTRTRPTPQREPTPKPIIGLPRLDPPPRSSQQSFDVLARIKGEFKKVGRGFSYTGALGFGSDFVGRRSSAATFTLAPSQDKITNAFKGEDNLADFRRKGGLFIEKRSARISSPSEKREITYKGLRTRKLFG